MVGPPVTSQPPPIPVAARRVAIVSPALADRRVAIVSPALADANNGNWHTARRWQTFLAPRVETVVTDRWQGEPADLLIALHARRSADAVRRFRDAHPARPIVLVLTGTDLYRDLDPASCADDGSSEVAGHAVECASRVVVLQDEALVRLGALIPAARAKACVIVQSAPAWPAAPHRRADFIAVGHLRDEKDPLTLLRAVRRLAAQEGRAAPCVVHLGRALDPALGRAAERVMAESPHAYRWLGGRSQPAARRWMARAGALVHPSRMEGGANVVVEALRSGVPVLASRIDGNVGLLGRDYDGYFACGDAAALAVLMHRFIADAAFADRLRAQCAARALRFAPEIEAAAVRVLVEGLLADG